MERTGRSTLSYKLKYSKNNLQIQFEFSIHVTNKSRDKLTCMNYKMKRKINRFLIKLNSHTRKFFVKANEFS